MGETIIPDFINGRIPEGAIIKIEGMPVEVLADVPVRMVKGNLVFFQQGEHFSWFGLPVKQIKDSRGVEEVYATTPSAVTA